MRFAFALDEAPQFVVILGVVYMGTLGAQSPVMTTDTTSPN